MSSAPRDRGGREKILRSATRIFASQGYQGTTTAAIARDAEVTQPLIHHHFSSKEGLWQAVLEAIFAEFDTMRAEAIAATAEASFLDRIRALLRAFVRFSAQRPELARIMILESAEAGPVFEHLYETHVRRRLEMFGDLLDQAASLGLLRPVDRDLIPSFIIGSCVHPFVAPETVRHFTGTDPLEPAMADRYADLVSDLLIRALLETGAA